MQRRGHTAQPARRAYPAAPGVDTMNKSLWIPTLIASGAALGALFTLPASSARAQDEDEPVKDGKWHYTRQCAGCHNDNGDGKGPTITQLGLQARDFKQGGFAFGDSREQMKRTITSGIPGRSPMPSFKGILDDDEMELVIDYVRTLMPPRDETPPKNTEMIVKDRALIARGKLPPITEGAPEVPRGLLIGTPEGMTFEYDISDVRLLGVRLGRFANREDWGDRGGAFLRPLGQLVRRTDDDFRPFSFEQSTREAITGEKLELVLAGTWIRNGTVGLSYAVRQRSSKYVELRCEETVRAEILSIGPAFTRSWKFEAHHINDMAIGVAGASGGKWYPAPQTGDPTARWWLRDREDKSVEAVVVTTNETLSAAEVAIGTGRLEFSLSELGETKLVHVTATFVDIPQWSEELRLKLEKELGL